MFFPFTASGVLDRPVACIIEFSYLVHKSQEMKDTAQQGIRRLFQGQLDEKLICESCDRQQQRFYNKNVEQLRKNSEKSQVNLAKPVNYLPTVYLLYTSPWLQRPKHKHKHLRNKPFKMVI